MPDYRTHIFRPIHGQDKALLQQGGGLNVTHPGFQRSDQIFYLWWSFFIIADRYFMRLVLSRSLIVYALYQHHAGPYKPQSNPNNLSRILFK
jgi:hypothetical protein